MEELLLNFKESVFLVLFRRIWCYLGQHTRRKPKLSRSKRRRRHSPEELLIPALHY